MAPLANAGTAFRRLDADKLPCLRPREMTPWIRSWGASVEVLEPADLREELAAEARALANLYE